mmetsp:Transcript_53712/g.165257  ORF Transcript_53712/g.165257 Transcript_53712/m.165257 type:complete len:156 (+) Transcript_53712:203-670(+)
MIAVNFSHASGSFERPMPRQLCLSDRAFGALFLCRQLAVRVHLRRVQVDRAYTLGPTPLLRPPSDVVLALRSVTCAQLALIALPSPQLRIRVPRAHCRPPVPQSVDLVARFLDAVVTLQARAADPIGVDTLSCVADDRQAGDHQQYERHMRVSHS